MQRPALPDDDTPSQGQGCPHTGAVRRGKIEDSVSYLYSESVTPSVKIICEEGAEAVFLVLLLDIFDIFAYFFSIFIIQVVSVWIKIS